MTRRAGVYATVACVLLMQPAVPVRAQPEGDDDEIIIIMDDDAPTTPAGKGAASPANPQDDDIIVIEEDLPEAAPTGPPRPPVPQLLRDAEENLPDAPFGVPRPPPLPLGELPLLLGPDSPTGAAPDGRSFLGLKAEHVTLTGTFGWRTGLRPMGSLTDDIWRNLWHAKASVDVRPDAPFRLHVDLWARTRSAMGVLPVDLAQLTVLDALLPWRKTDLRNRFSGVVEVGEAYAYVKLGRARITAGRQLFSLTQVLTSRLPDLLNPPDIRDGVAFPNDLHARSPVAALHVRGNVDALGLEGIVVPFYAPPRAPLYAEDAEAYDLNPSVLPLVTSRRAVGNDAQASALQRAVPRADTLAVGDLSPTVAGRASFAFMDADVTLVAIVGHDPVPQITASGDVARALALAADRRSQASISEALKNTCRGRDCSDVTAGLKLRWRRTAMIQAEANRPLGPAIIRVAGWLVPRFLEFGRSAHIITRDNRLEHASLWAVGGTVAVESGYTELVQGFVELGWELLGGIPAGARVARYDTRDQAFPTYHATHRPTVSVRLQGVVLDDVTWRLRGTLAPWQRDLGVAPRLGYRLSLHQEVAFGVEFFSGWPGSRGYFLQPQSRAYLEWGYRF